MRNPPWIYLAGHVGIVLALALLCANLLAPAFAQAAEESVKEEAEPIVDLAPVIVDGENLFFVIGVSAEPAEKRAAVSGGEKVCH
jgi:hypothetical protein